MKTFFSAAFACTYFFCAQAMEHNSIEKNVENLLNLINATAISLNEKDNLSSWFCFAGYVGRLETYIHLDLIKDKTLKLKADTAVNVSNETIQYYLKNKKNNEQKKATFKKWN